MTGMCLSDKHNFSDANTLLIITTVKQLIAVRSSSIVH